MTSGSLVVFSWSKGNSLLAYSLIPPSFSPFHDLCIRYKNNRKTCPSSSPCKISNRYHLHLSFASHVLIAIPSPGYLPEKDAAGKEKWPKGDESVWKGGMRGLDTGTFCISIPLPSPQSIHPHRRSFHHQVYRQPRPDIPCPSGIQHRRYRWLSSSRSFRPGQFVGRYRLTHRTHHFCSQFLQLNWNDTQTHYTRNPTKRAYYLSLEFLMGRTLDNAVRISTLISFVLYLVVILR